VERLHADPDLRRRLGRSAHAHAIHAWSPDAAAARWTALYERLLSEAKRTRAWGRDPELTAAAARAPGAVRFIDSLGSRGDEFSVSLMGADPDAVLAADRAIAASSAALRSADCGGILHYRRRYPDDPYVRLWAGLVLGEQGRPALAAGEFAWAARHGVDRAGAHA
jgi:hypothetical protein